MKQFKEYITEKLSFRDALYKFSCKIMGWNVLHKINI